MQVEKRATPRQNVTGKATLQVLGATPSGNGEPLEVGIVDMSEQGMRLESPCAVDAGQAVKVEAGDAMFLGEVCYCAAMEGAGYYVGVVTTQCLSGLRSLQHLIEALRPEGSRENIRV
jgi:hypothetical protein